MDEHIEKRLIEEPEEKDGAGKPVKAAQGVERKERKEGYFSRGGENRAR